MASPPYGIQPDPTPPKGCLAYLQAVVVGLTAIGTVMTAFNECADRRVQERHERQLAREAKFDANVNTRLPEVGKKAADSEGTLRELVGGK